MRETRAVCTCGGPASGMTLSPGRMTILCMRRRRSLQVWKTAHFLPLSFLYSSLSPPLSILLLSCFLPSCAFFQALVLSLSPCSNLQVHPTRPAPSPRATSRGQTLNPKPPNIQAHPTRPAPCLHPRLHSRPCPRVASSRCPCPPFRKFSTARTR